MEKLTEVVTTIHELIYLRETFDSTSFKKENLKLNFQLVPMPTGDYLGGPGYEDTIDRNKIVWQLSWSGLREYGSHVFLGDSFEEVLVFSLQQLIRLHYIIDEAWHLNLPDRHEAVLKAKTIYKLVSGKEYQDVRSTEDGTNSRS